MTRVLASSREPSGSQIGHKESIKDTARVLGRMYDGIQYRGYGQEIVETLAESLACPVWNGLTNEFSPTPVAGESPHHAGAFTR